MLYCEQSVGTGGCLSSLTPIRISNQSTTINRISDLFPEPEPRMIRAKLNSSVDIQTIVENSLEAQSRATVEAILEAISQLSPLEKLLLYIKLPTGKTLQDPLKQPTNPLGSRPEISLTVSWIKTHLKEDSKTSLPKQDVYNEYMEYCHINEMKALSTADFGKVMKQVYPNMRPRRLGTRGNSRYCYSGLSSRASLPTPTLPILPSLDGTIVCRWAANMLGQDETFSSIANLEHHLLDNNLVPKKSSHFNNSSTNDKVYAMSSKICRPPDKKLEDRRKSLGESPSTSKGAPERCKGKRSNSTSSTASIIAIKKEPLKRLAIPSLPTTPVISTPATPVASTATPTTPAEDIITTAGVNTSKTTSPLTKLPIPRLPKIISTKTFACSTALPVVKRHKIIVPKDLIGDSNNSFEQEEELLNYFRRQGDDESKSSTLRMLLEQSKEHSNRGSAVGGSSKGVLTASVSAGPSGSRSTSRASSAGIGITAARRRVSFDPPPPSDTSQKKFSFVPISPISPGSPQFVTPQTPSSLPSPHMRPASVADPPLSAHLVTSVASSSLDAPLLHGILNNSQLYSTGWRSQSVPACVLPEITPVPSEATDFDMTESDSSNLLDSDSLGGDNLGQILSYITELESPSVADAVRDVSFKEEQPDSESSFNGTYPQISALLDASTDLFDDSLSLDCSDAFESLAQSVCTQPKGF